MFIDQDIEQQYRVCSDTTNNNAEIKAIRLGVEIAIRFKNRFSHINIFSDSQISIFGIRDYIFNWKNINGIICGYQNKPIANQSVFLEILDMIVRSDLHINFWHQKGHVDMKQSSLYNALHVFQSSNGIRGNVSLGFIKYISFWNDMVDNESRKKLLQTNFTNPYREPLCFQAQDFYQKLEIYKYLIQK